MPHGERRSGIKRSVALPTPPRFEGDGPVGKKKKRGGWPDAREGGNVRKGE